MDKLEQLERLINAVDNQLSVKDFEEAFSLVLQVLSEYKDGLDAHITERVNASLSELSTSIQSLSKTSKQEHDTQVSTLKSEITALIKQVNKAVETAEAAAIDARSITPELVDYSKVQTLVDETIEDLVAEERVEKLEGRVQDLEDDVEDVKEDIESLKKRQPNTIFVGGGGSSSSGGSGAVDSVNGETGVVVLTSDDISDAAQTNKWATAAEKTKLGYISVTQAVDLDTLESDTATNNAKVTNATHTGDVTGSTALTVDKTAITGKTAATPVGADYFLFSDTSDSGNLKKGLISDLPSGGGGGGTWGTITGTLSDQADLLAALNAKSDVGHGHVAADVSDFDAAADARASAAITTHTAAADPHAQYQKESEKGAANGYASLGVDGKIPSSQLPAIAITDTFVVASQVAMLALSAETGDVAVRTDENKSYILKGTDPSALADWEWMRTQNDLVLSVNGQTGAITLITSNIAEGSNLYFTNARAIGAVLTGFAAAGARTAIVAADSILAAFGKAQKYFNDLSALAFSGNASDLAGTKTSAFISDFNAAALAAAPAETATTTGALINAATSKTTPVDADALGLMDSAASNVLKKLTWANLKATLKTYFDTLYAAASHTHALSSLTQSGATTGQVPQWNGSSWVPQTPSGGGSSDTVIDPQQSSSWFSQQLLQANLGTAPGTIGGIIEWAPGSAAHYTYYLPAIVGGTNDKLFFGDVKRIICRQLWRRTSSVAINGFGFGAATNSVYLAVATAGARACFTWTDASTLYCVTSDGAGTPTSTLVTGSPVSGNWNDYKIDYDPQNTSCKFYFNGTLVATHTTELPVSASDECRYMLGANGSTSIATSPIQVAIKIV